MGLQIRQKLASLGPILADRCSKSDNLLGAYAWFELLEPRHNAL